MIHASIGHVGFRNGQLRYVSRDWLEESKSDAVLNSIYGVLRELTKGKATRCVVETASENHPDGESKSIYMWMSSRGFFV
jgi:hypothetical protein